MAQQSTPDEDYQELKRFFVHWWTHLAPDGSDVNHPGSPVRSLEWIEAAHGRSRALTGLKQAVNDILEWVPDLTPEERAKADASLAAAGSPTLSAMWQRRSASYRALLRRGKIRNDVEFHLVSSVLADTVATLSDHERDVLGSMASSYESRRG